MYYVSFITEYPIYEPAEGGYYYAGTRIEDCREFSSWKKANKCFQEWRKWFRDEYGYFEPERVHDLIVGGCGKYINPCISFNSKYIGEGARIELTRKKPVEHGYEPYC